MRMKPPQQSAMLKFLGFKNATKSKTMSKISPGGGELYY